MASRPILRASAAGCSAYRSTCMRLIYSPHTPAIPRMVSIHRPKTTSFLLPSRSFSTSRSMSNSTGNFTGNEEVEIEESNEWGEEDLKAALAEEAETGSQQEIEINNAAESEEAPWYLQEEPPRHPTLVPELQPLPKIPQNTPAILGDLVKCLAEDMGLDDLNLMDLRSLDPPAALGPSLIMLFGTARSERHLHISAGRLKSWLRKKGFNADADGLIGRKDFKIALRRRQRKAKLLGTTPSLAESGLTTRWICMNLGTIEYQSTEEMPLESDSGTLTGFGIRQTGGTTIVVQMFTESKRKEMELELLWSRILARRSNKLLVEDDLEYAEANAHPNEVSIFTEGGSPKVIARPSQRRFFSTSCRRLLPPDGYNQVTSPSIPTPASSSVDISLDPVKDLTAKVAKLEHMQTEFSGFPFSTAVEALSPLEAGHQRRWVEQWNDTIKDLAPEQSWRFRLWLVTTGRKLGIDAYTVGMLHDLVQEMELLGIICERGQYLALLQAVYLDGSESNIHLAEQADLALNVLNIMFERGEPIIATDVCVSLLESLARTNSPSKEKGYLQSVLEKFMLQADLPYIGEEGAIRLLDAYAAQGNWERWWDVWRMAPQHGRPRSQSMYIHMWTTLAATQNQRRCREALRTYFFEMINEQPPVKPEGAVKEAIEACMRVADPQAEQLAKKLNVTDNRSARAVEAEFVHMWRVLNPEWVTGRRGQ